MSNQSAGESLLSQLTSDFISVTTMDPLQLRAKIAGILSTYEIRHSQLPGANLDVQDKIRLFLAAKKLEGLSPLTLDGYKLELRIFADKIKKPIADISTSDIRVFLGDFPELKSSSI